jgi:hypothetical protein
MKIGFVYSYIENTTNDWFKIKREILNNINNKQRTRFSTRHPRSKKHYINRLEKEIINYWKVLSGTDVYIDLTRLHNEKQWELIKHRTRGWKLKQINEEKHKTDC